MCFEPVVRHRELPRELYDRNDAKEVFWELNPWIKVYDEGGPVVRPGGFGDGGGTVPVVRVGRL